MIWKEPGWIRRTKAGLYYDKVKSDQSPVLLVDFPEPIPSFQEIDLQWFSGTTWYVDPSGSDSTGDGSAAHPWASLSHALSIVTTYGDLIQVNSGTYTDAGHGNLAVGVNIQGSGKNLVTINCSTGDPTYGSYITAQSGSQTNGSHTVSGLSFAGGNTANLWALRFRGRYNVIVHDVNFSNFGGRTALRIEGDWNTTSSAEPSWYATGVQVYNCNFTNCAVTNFGSLEIESLDGALIHDNIFDTSTSGMNGRGLKHANYGWFKAGQVYNNSFTGWTGDGNSFGIECYNWNNDSKFYNNTFRAPLSLNGGLQTRIGGSTWNLQIYNNTWDVSMFNLDTFLELSHNWLLFDSNYVTGNSSAGRCGIWMTNYLTSTGVQHAQLSRNVIRNVAHAGISVESGIHSYLNFWNNTIDGIYSAGWGGNGLNISGGTITNCTAQDNIIINCQSYWAYCGSGVSGAVISYNFHYGNGASDNYADGGSGNTWSNNTHANPQLNYSGIVPDPYYRPSSGSSNVVGAGVDVGFGTTIGAYQFSGDIIYLYDNSSLNESLVMQMFSVSVAPEELADQVMVVG